MNLPRAIFALILLTTPAAAADNPLTGLQDHGSPCWFKNIKVRPLK